MKYTKFLIRNYKGISHVEIDLLNDRVITLVGLNESGKTTIMEALHWFYRMIKDDKPNEQDLKQIRPKGTDFNGDIEISGYLELEDKDITNIQSYWKNELKKRTRLEIPKTFSYVYKFWYEADKHKKTTKNCGFYPKTTTSSKMLFSSSKEDWRKLVQHIKDSITPEILYYDDFIFEIPKKIRFIKETASDGTEIEQGLRESNRVWQPVLDDILRSTNPNFDSFADRVVSNWDKDSDLANQHISQMEGKLNEIITNRWRELFIATDRGLNFDRIKLDCSSPDGDFLDVSFSVITKSHKSFRIDERSKGCKWFFSFLLFTEFRKNRTRNILFLLDEPASNLHSSAQVKILDALKDLSEDALVVYATHSHHLIRIDWLSGAYIIQNEALKDGLDGSMTFVDKVNITAKKYFQFVGDGSGDDKVSYLQPILDALDYRPSTVEPIPDICILEGKSDWYTMKYFSEIILKDKSEYNFYPGAGATKLWDIIRLYMSWGKNFIVIVDGDKAGVGAKQDYINELGAYIENKIFTLKDAVGISGATEKLISDEDKKSITAQAHGIESTKKKALNQAINKLLADNTAAKISSGTKANFRRLFKFVRGRA